jgi:phosphoenolpyruvate-protein kinase (PTS system EI component)
MNPLSIGMIRRVLREVSMEEARKIAQKALTLITSKEVHEYVLQAVSGMVSFDIRAYGNDIAAANGRST